MALICLVLFTLMKLQIFEIVEWKYYSLSFETFLFFLKSIPILILVASFHYFIFEAIHTVVAQVSFLFLIVFILCYISGCFYPSEFFPQIIQTISIHLPVGLAFDFMRKNILKADIKLPLIEILSYTIIFISLSVFCRRKKLNDF